MAVMDVTALLLSPVVRKSTEGYTKCKHNSHNTLHWSAVWVRKPSFYCICVLFIIIIITGGGAVFLSTKEKKTP